MKEQQEQKGSLYRVRPRSRRRWLEQTPTLFSTLLFLFFLLSSPSLAQDTSSDLVEYDCVYTNSTVPSCSSVCSQTCFYSLLPATCSPEGNDLVYESISRPDSTGPSVMFDDAYNVPQSVLERLSPSNLFLNPFTLSMWVYPMGEIADNSSVLIQIESMDVELTLYVDSRWLLITNSSSISTMNSYNTTHRLNLHQWTHLTVIASEQDELLIAVNNSLLNTSLTIDPNSDEPISISLAGDVSGDYHFPGLMSDVGVFSNSLSASQVSILAGGFTPPEFLPQCLCREGLESELCDGSLRYRINSHPVEFITDNNVSTYWESSNSSVTVSLGLATVTSLSKIFLDFRDFSPAALRLQYLMEPTKVWNDIQFYARDCSTSFGQEESNSVNSISSVICQAISSNDTSLAFYVTANGHDKFSAESLSSTFNASQIRLVIQSTSMEMIRLERVQVCSNFETNLNTLPSCMALISSSSSYSFDATRSSSDVLFTMESVDSATETLALDSSMIISSVRSSSFLNLISSSESLVIATSGVESIFPSSTQSVMNIENINSSPFALTTSNVVLTQSSSLEQAAVSSSDLLMSESNVMITSSETFVFLSSVDVAPSSQSSTSSLVLESTQELVSQSPSVEAATTPSLLFSTELTASLSLSGSIMIPSPSPSEDVAIESSLSLASSIVLMTSSIETGVASDILSVSDMLSFNFTSAIVSSELLLSSSDDLIVSPSPSRVITTSEVVLTSSDVSLSSSDNDMNFVSVFISFLASSTEVSSSVFDITSSSVVPSSFVTLTQFPSSSSTLEMTSFLDTEGFGMATISEQTSTLQLPTIEATSSGEIPSSTIEVSSIENIELSPSLSIEATSSSNEGIELTPSLTIQLTSIEATSSEGIEETPSLSIEASSIELTSSLSIEATSSEGIEETPSLSIEAFSIELTSSLSIEATSSEGIELTIEVSSTQEIEFTSSFDIVATSSESIKLTQSLSIEATSTENLASPSIFEVSSSEEIEATLSFTIEVSSSLEIESTSPSIIEVSSSPEIEPTSSSITEVSSSPEIEPTSSLIIEESSSLEIEPSSSLILTEVSSSPEIEPTSSSIIEVSSSPEIEPTSSLIIEESSSLEIEPTSSLILTEVSSSPEIEPTSSSIIEVSSSPEIEPTSSLIIEESSSLEIEPTSSLILTEVSSSPEIEPTSSSIIEVSSSPEIEPTSSSITEVSSSPEIEPTSSLIIEESSSLEIEPTSSLILTKVSSSLEIEPTSSSIIEVSSSPEIEPTSSLIIEESSSLEIEPTSSLILTEVSSSPEIEPTSSSIIEVSSSPEIEPTSSLILTEVSSSPEIEPTSSLIIEVSSSPEIEPTSSLIIEESSSLEIEPTSSLILTEVSSSPEIEPTSSLIIEVSSSPEIEPTSSLILTEVSSSPEIEPTSSSIIEVSSSPEIGPTSSSIIEVSSSPEIEPTSSSIIEESSSPEIGPTSSLITEVSSSPEIGPTSSFIIEVSSTEVIQSSSIEVSSSEEIEPTPSPTIAISSSEEIEPTTSLVLSPSPSSTFSFISVSVTPTVTINEGFGVILEEPQKIDSNDNLMYNFSFGLFGIKLAGEDASSITAQIGNFSVQESFTQSLQTIKSITGALSTDSLWPDQPLLTVLVQARDMFNNTLVGTFSPLIITAEHSTLGLMEFYECESLPVVSSGTCTAMIGIDDDWFISNEISFVTFTIEINETIFTIGSVELHSPPSISLTNSLYIQLPQTPLMPGGSASLFIKSSYNYSIFGFNIDCRLEGEGENAAFVSPHSPQEYSLLYEYYQDQKDRIALSGFRNRNQFSTALVNRTLGDQTLVTFNLSNISENYDISCYSKGLSLTTRLVLVPVQESTRLPVLMISRDGNASEVGEILHQEKRVAAILPYARHNTFLNIATVNGSRQDLGAIKAIALYNDGTFDETSSLACTSLDKDAIQVESDCSNIYFNGSETDGIDANITVRHAALNDYSSLLVRVWILRQNTIAISLKDSVLNATGTCNNSTFYQTSKVSLQGIIRHNAQMHTVVVTPVLKHLLTTVNASIAIVDDTRVVGQSPGTTGLCLGSSCTNVTVSNEFASPLYLSLFSFSSLTINLDSLSIDSEQAQIGLISVGQEFHYRSQPVFINTLLVYEDDSAIDIDTSSELYLSVSDNQIYDRLYFIQDGDDETMPVIGGTWSQCSETVSGSVAINISLYSPLSILIDAITLTMAPRNDPLVVLGYAQSDSLLTLIAEYEDPDYDGPITSNATYNVTVNDTSVLTFSTDANGSITLYPVQQGYAIVQVYVFEYDLSSSINVTILESEPQIRFLLNTNSSEMPVNTIQHIANTQHYQEVRAEAILNIFLTNTTQIVTNAVFTSGNDSILQLNGNTVSVNGVLSIDQNVNITATLNGGERNITAIASLGISTDSCDVTGVQIDFPNEFIDFPGMERIANCRVMLCNGSLIEKAFNSQTGDPLYGNEFVSIGISDSNAAIVMNNTSIIKLVGTAVEPVSVYCTSGNFRNTVSVIFNTLPNEGEVDLGTNDGLPFTTTDESEVMIPVTIGAGVYKIGAVEINIQYDPETALFLTASQGMDWSNGSLSVAEVSTNSLRLGGVLNNGVRDSTLHLANVYFKMLEGASNNVTILRATPVLLAVGNLSLTNVTPGNPRANTLSVTLPNSRSRRDLRRAKRQVSTSCPPYPVGDINADCCVDQRDVYYFQEYNLASIHNFTGSEEASLINQTIEDNGIVVDVDGDGFVTLDDIVTVEQVSSGLVYNMSASYDISCDCSFVINISISTVNGLQVETESLHVFVHLAHNQSQFIEQVNDIQFSYGSLHQVFEDNNGLYTAVLRANLSTSGDTTALYQVRGISSFSMPDVGLSFIQAVADNNGEISESRVSGLFGSTPLSGDREGPFIIDINATDSQIISLTLDDLMPHIIINPTCINIPPTTLPSLPLLLQVNRDEYFVGNVTQLNQTYYEGRVLILSNSGSSMGGSVTASVESLQTSLSVSRSLSQVNSLRHPIASFDEYSKILTTTIQAFNNIDYAFNIQSSTINISIVTQSNDAIANTLCIPNSESGVCQSSFNLSSYDFSQLTVTFSLIGNEGNVVESSMVTVNVSSKLSFQGDGVSILLPSYTLKPGSSFDIEVYSNTTYPLISFLFNFTLSARISLTSTHSPDRLWGVYCTQSLSCVGYRTNFQSLSVSQLSSPEHLFTASLYIPEDYTESSVKVSASIREMNNLFYQPVSFTGIMIVNASGSGHLNEATVSIDPSNDLIALYAHAPQTELVNTAVLNEGLVTIPISVSGLYENNTIASISGYSCQLSDSEVSLHINSDCSAVFVNGSETKGADNVILTITLESVTTSIGFKVWFPSLPAQLQLGSNVLKAIDGAIDATSCGAQLYQSTTITAISNLTTGTESLINVDLSQYVLNRIRFTPAGSIELNETSRMIQGISPATVTLYPTLNGLFDNVTFQVSQERVSIHYLYTIILSSISLRVSDDSSSSGEYNFYLSLSSSFQYVNDTGVSVTLAVFSDGSTMPVTDLVSVSSSNKDILYSTDNELFTAVSNGSTTISTEWYNPSTANCTPTVSCLRTSYDDVSLSLSLPTELIVMASSVQLTACEAIAQLLPSIPLQVELYALLVYPNGDEVNVTEYVSINDTVRGGDDDSVIILNANTLNNQSTTLLFSYTASGVTLMKTISIEVVSINASASNLSLLSVPGNNPITTFNSIEGSIIYQQAQLVGNIAFSNGMVMSLSSLPSSMYSIDQSSDAISINNMSVTIQSPPNTQTTVTINLMLTGCNEVVVSTTVTINPPTDNNNIINVNSVSITTPLIGREGDAVELDVSLNLNGGVIYSLRDFASNARANITDIVSFTTTDNEYIRITPSTATCILHRQSGCSNVTIAIAITGGTFSNNVSASVVILPGSLEIGLKGPVSTISTNALVSLPLSLNTHTYTISGIEGSLIYNSSLLQVVNLTVEDTQWPGGVIFHSTESINDKSVLIFSGLAFNGGVTGDNVHFANVNLMTKNEGSTEIYAYLTNLIQYKSNSIPINKSVSTSSRITLSISDNDVCNEPPYQSNPLPITSNCSSNTLQLASGESSISCPVSLNSTTETLYSLLQTSGDSSVDVNLNGVSDLLDPLYVTQVSSGLLYLLSTYPVLANSTRDTNGNYCNVTISSKLIGRDGRPPTDLSLYYLLNIHKNYSFDQLFNASSLISSNDSNVLLIPSTYDEETGEFTSSLSTMLTEIPGGTVSVSLIQSTQVDGSEYSPARVLLMNKRNGETMIQESLSIDTADIIIHQNPPYAPLLNFTDDIICPPLPLPPTLFEVFFDVEPSSRSFSFRIEESSDFGSIFLYNCSLIENVTCLMSFRNHTNFNVSDSFNISGTRYINVTVAGLSPYTNYTFYLLNTDNQTITLNETITTAEAQPAGFNSLMVLDSRPTSITIKWALPTEPNGVLLSTEVLIVSMTGGARRKRELDDFVMLSIEDTRHTITNLSIATVYNITVRISNSVDSVSQTISANTTFPEANFSTSVVQQLDGCVNLTSTEWIYDPVEYDISLHCTADSMTSNTVNTSLLDNGINDIVICSDGVENGTGLNTTFECMDSYTVTFTFMRNGFNTTSETTIQNISIFASTVTSTVITPVSSSSEVSSSMEMSLLPTSMFSSASTFSSTLSTPFSLSLSSTLIETSTPLSSMSSLSSSPSPSTSSSMFSGVNMTATSTAASPSTSTMSPSTDTTSPSIVTTTSSTSMNSSMTSPSSSNTPETTSPGSAQTGIAVGVVLSIILLLVIVLIVVILLVMRRRTKKRGTMDFYRPGSRTSKDYWFEVEETVEMSPIDIVPVDHQPYDDHYLDETVMNSGIIENKGVYEDETISHETSLSSRALVNHIKPQPRQGRTVTFNSADPSSFTEPTRPSYDDVVEDNESLIDLNFSEDAISQPYLSLGLTPLSQLSPDPLTSSGNPDLGFFPSMLPPVSPMTSLKTGTGISVDSPDTSGLDNLVMPDAMLNYSVPLNDVKRRPRNRQDPKESLLNGNVPNSRTLEPLIERRSLEVDEFSSGASDFMLTKGLSSNDSLRAQQNMFNLMGNSITAPTGSSEESQEEDTCIFPSAHVEPSPPLKQKKVKAAPRSGRDPINEYFGGLELGGGSTEMSNYRNTSASTKPQPSSYTSPVHQVATSSFMDSLMDEPKQRRQLAREKAKAEQKALLMKQREEEELQKQAKSRSIHDSIVKSYSTFSDSPNKQPPPSLGIVLQKAAHIEAAAELLEEESKKVKNSQQSQDSIGTGIDRPRYPSVVFSPQHRYSSRPRQASTDSVDMKVTDDQITAL